ncbi:hypothetical protein OAF77_00790 [Akkermansiaceae bacterium]|nr:hypothetical protein [Akkermansiaceae bacterium]
MGIATQSSVLALSRATFPASRYFSLRAYLKPWAYMNHHPDTPCFGG